jgi:hypothetical protein
LNKEKSRHVEFVGDIAVDIYQQFINAGNGTNSLTSEAYRAQNCTATTLGNGFGASDSCSLAEVCPE